MIREFDKKIGKNKINYQFLPINSINKTIKITLYFLPYFLSRYLYVN